MSRDQSASQAPPLEPQWAELSLACCPLPLGGEKDYVLCVASKLLRFQQASCDISTNEDEMSVVAVICC